MDSEIVWVEHADSLSCEVPDRAWPVTKIPGWIGLAAAALLTVGFIAVVGMLFLFLPEEAPVLPMLLGVGGFLGVFLFPVVGFIYFKSLLVVFGRKRLKVDAHWIQVITQFGPLRSKRRCRLSRLGGFRIEDPNGQGYQLDVEYSSLLAVQQDGRQVHLLRGYANEVVAQLFEELPQKIELITGRSAAMGSEVVRANELQAELAAPDPFRIQNRRSKPIGSELSLQQEGQETVITIPPLGFRKSTPTVLRYWCAGFMFAELVLLTGLVPALLSGKVEGQPAAGWLIVGVFTLIAIFIVFNRIHASIRRGSIRLGRDSLSFREHGIFGQHRAEWERDSIESVRVAVEEYSTTQSVSYDHFVQVEPATGVAREWFCNREKIELEWIVTNILGHLDRDARVS